MIKPEQDSKVEKPHLLLPLNRKRKKKHKIIVCHYSLKPLENRLLITRVLEKKQQS